MKAADYLVVGAGSAGCVLANRLTEDPAVRVLLLEAGPPDDNLAIRVPLAFARLLGTKYDWDYATIPQVGLNGRRISWPRGKTLGGSSSINAQVYLRGHRRDFDDWTAVGNEGWSFEDVLPYFLLAEHDGVEPFDVKGPPGALHVAPLRSPSRLTNAFVQACIETGMAASPDLNGPEPDGVAVVPVTQRRGRRWSTADGYLRPALSRPNLEVVTGAHVTRISFEGRRATGVAYRSEAGDGRAAADGEVILCGGAVNSPQLLMLSGVGPAEHLQSHGIDVVHDLPGVGGNLQDHVVAPVAFAVSWARPAVPASSARSLLRFLVFRSGPLTGNSSEACAFARTDPQLPAPDVELVFAPAASMAQALPSTKVRVRRRLRRLREVAGGSPVWSAPAVTIGATLLTPRSAGTVRLRSGDWRAAPTIDPGYLTDPGGEDLRRLAAASRLAMAVAAAAGFHPVRDDPRSPPRGAGADDDALHAWIRRRATTLNHPVGSCSMGVDRLAVVDRDLRVHGIEGLRIVDASIIPTIGRGHMNAPTVMIAEKAADLIRGRPARAAAVVVQSTSANGGSRAGSPSKPER